MLSLRLVKFSTETSGGIRDRQAPSSIKRVKILSKPGSV